MGVAVVEDDAIASAAESVLIAVTINVGEGRHRAGGPHILAVEGIGRACLLREGWGQGRAGVAEIFEGANGIPAEDVHIAVAVNVDKDRGAKVSHILAVEGIGCPRLLGEGRGQGRAGVAVIFEGARLCSAEGVQVTIAVNVDEGRGAVTPDIYTVERIGCPRLLAEGWGQGGARIAVVEEEATGFADESVHVAIAVNVGEGWKAVSPHIYTVERIGCARLLGEGWCQGCARVAVVENSTSATPAEDIYIAVAVNVDEGRGVKAPRI